MELSAVSLPQDSIFQDSLATKIRQTGDKESERPERDQSSDSNQDNRGQLEVCEVRTVIKDLIPPGRSDYGGCAERDWREGG
jgi:hypothetical protein